jgi:peptide/nickel transport system permease protein
MALRTYILRRVTLMFFVVLSIMTITFFLIRIIPSDPVSMYLGGGRVPAEQAEQVRHTLGLDRPMIVQYGMYLKDFATGDWGVSIRTHRPVLADIIQYLPASLELIFAGMILATLVGVLLGAAAANKKGSSLDHGGRVFSIAGVSLPAFFLAILLQLVFFRALGWLPVSGQADLGLAQQHPVTAVTHMYAVDALITGNWTAFRDALRHVILPALALAAAPTAIIMRMTRSSMLETMEADHVRMARAMGVPSRLIVYRYALKNALAPVCTVIGLEFAYALIATFYIELTFAWPGLGTYATNSITSLDYPAIVGVTVIVALIYATVNMIVDLVIAWLDPRIVLS